ncbi:polynucleotide adenylyltransferase PcnB [Aestuariirhabdus litorea]|uniref:Poly(A) polymerase I n=1 Tax=Aestuariirhabdus litorea TaxID=2528527 RepID=A0A3P3VHQ5_9GAMM|nr:polynucleotide adenylyltransferase PcnB [Aestuariirhabdus litorea]RRJ82250.1 polynucleotide adenylyltransferase PcnB [Aestuariirhabdus litorea]RWW92418.1 polynucleotide adenylyltransferase PcnB [Endozoicomonadaceae bacterium GTF-13]
MLKRLFRKLRPSPSGIAMPTQTLIPRDHHTVSRKRISDNALKVLRRLQEGGFDAFLVGGCIRDILLGHHPKDFDVATNATPEQVRGLFRNSRLIGRRFKLVHVQFGREIIEVATFRADHSAATGRKDKSRVADSGRILRDNVYGTIEQDAIRRDFTMNALYYTSEDFSIRDFTDGLRDIKQRKIRLIGDPTTRYQEDPVRMLRAVRFAAKLDFTIEKQTAAPIRPLAHLLGEVPAARMFDEILKLLQAGRGHRTFTLMQEYHLLEPLFPATHRALTEDSFYQRMIESALHNTDERLRQRKPVTPAFLFAALLWGPLQACRKEIEAQGIPPIPALQQAIQVVINNQSNHTTIPKRFGIPMREIWELQDRLPRRQGKRAEQLMEHPRFRAAYDFMLLRCEAGESELKELCDWWTHYQTLEEGDRRTLSQQIAPQKRSRPRRRRRKPANPS